MYYEYTGTNNLDEVGRTWSLSALKPQWEKSLDSVTSHPLPTALWKRVTAVMI